MTSNNLVPVFTGTLQDQSTQLCNARDLHAFLAVGDRLDQWIRRRIEEYGFTDGEDFCTNLCKIPGQRGAPRTDYHLSLDMAKELAMIENNDQGRAVRRYFIQIEKAAHLQKKAAPAAALPPKKVIRSRADLSFVKRNDQGCYINHWSVKHDDHDNFGTSFKQGEAFFKELAELAARDEEEAFIALRAAIGCDWQAPEGTPTDWQPKGWGTEYGFADALARAVIDGLRHQKAGNDGFTPGVKKARSSIACAIAAPVSVKRIAA